MKTIQVMLGVLLCLLAGCKDKENNFLVVQEWQLEEAPGIDSLDMPQEKPTLLFTDSTAVYGFAGCNRFFGRYETSGKSKLHIQPGGMTMMYCPDIRFEDVFVKVLARTSGYQGNPEKLQLVDSAGRVTLVFVPKDTTKSVGVAEDSHGCNAAAGYTWSEVRQDCIRLFETGIQLVSVTDTAATEAAYIVFTTDSQKAEVFLPSEQTHPILERHDLPEGGYIWKETGDGIFTIRKSGDKWILERDQQELYRQE